MSAIDLFRTFVEGLTSPSRRLLEVTVHDVNELSLVTRALYIGSTGDVTVEDAEGNEVTFVSVPAGTLLPIRVKRVLATGTDASDIVALV